MGGRRRAYRTGVATGVALSDPWLLWTAGRTVAQRLPSGPTTDSLLRGLAATPRTDARPRVAASRDRTAQPSRRSPGECLVPATALGLAAPSHGREQQPPPLGAAPAAPCGPGRHHAPHQGVEPARR